MLNFIKSIKNRPKSLNKIRVYLNASQYCRLRSIKRYINKEYDVNLPLDVLTNELLEISISECFKVISNEK
jgi:hypothetical protein